jgi:glycosyltransferase involved in cell wall biosynthesis
MNSRGRLRVAFVVQRCGLEVIGGAESLCLQVAKHLGELADIEVLTTCAIDYQTWRNEYPEGYATVDGVRVRRFRVDRERHMASFNRLSRELAFDPPSATLDAQTEWMRRQGPISSELFAHLSEYESAYDLIVFFGYLYATTYFALPRVAERSVLMPFAHDEWPIRLSMWDDVFAAPRAILYSTLEEREFVRKRFSSLPGRGPIIGTGISAPPDRNPERFRKAFNIDEPFLLYLGRIEPSKGVNVLFEDFVRYRSTKKDPFKLVLVGRVHSAVAKHPDIVAVGQLDERTKWDAIEACEAMVVPSQYESLSLALLEGWACAKPALVNARSKVLVGQCRRARGGVWYDSYEEFAVALDLLDKPTRATLGRQGQEHVSLTYNWNQTVRGFGDVFESIVGSA